MKVVFAYYLFYLFVFFSWVIVRVNCIKFNDKFQIFTDYLLLGKAMENIVRQNEIKYQISNQFDSEF